MKNYIDKIVLLFICIVIVGCVEYDADPFSGNTLPRKTEYGNDWLYYNLVENEYLNPKKSGDSLYGNTGIITERDHFDRTDWDIAFNRYNIRTNSGLSGIGKGGAYDMGLVDYDGIKLVSQIPENAKFVIDAEWQITMSELEWNKEYYPINKEPWFDPNSGPKQMKSTANNLLGKALVFSGPPPSYIPSNHVYILRTADGKKYFKLLIISWYDEYKKIGARGGKISYKCAKLKD